MSTVYYNITVSNCNKYPIPNIESTLMYKAIQNFL